MYRNHPASQNELLAEITGLLFSRSRFVADDYDSAGASNMAYVTDSITNDRYLVTVTRIDPQLSGEAVKLVPLGVGIFREGAPEPAHPSWCVCGHEGCQGRTDVPPTDDRPSESE